MCENFKNSFEESHGFSGDTDKIVGKWIFRREKLIWDKINETPEKIDIY